MRSKLTQLGVERLRVPAEGAVTLWDENLPGFGVRVSPRGRKTWIATYRVNGRAVMQTLGTTATVPKLADARDAARGAMLKAKAGVNPVEERRAAARAAEADKAATKAAAREAIEGRFEAVARRWLADGWRRSRAKRRWSSRFAAEVKRIVEHDVFPEWRDRPIRSITKADVDALLDAKSSRRERPRKGMENGADVQANRVLARLKTLFGWALAEGCVAADPTAGVTIRGQETERDRWLDDDELVWFWRGCERAGSPYGSIFRLMLLTGQRENEVPALRWAEINLETKTWTIPRERTRATGRTTCTSLARSCARRRGWLAIWCSRPASGPRSAASRSRRTASTPR
jgi:integrase